MLSVVASLCAGPNDDARRQRAARQGKATGSMRWPKGLRANGFEVDEGPTWWAVKPAGAGNVPGGATCASQAGTPAIAMSFMILAWPRRRPSVWMTGHPSPPSFPIFEPLMETVLGRM